MLTGYRPLLGVILAALLLSACRDKPPPNTEQGAAPPQPALQQGMRAYVDPVTGEYAPPPPVPQPTVPAAAVVAPAEAEQAPGKETPLPGGGVMLELGDRFQTEDKKPGQ